MSDRSPSVSMISTVVSVSFMPSMVTRDTVFATCASRGVSVSRQRAMLPAKSTVKSRSSEGRSPASVARIVAAVNGLDVDDAVHAIYACPEQPAGSVPGFGLTFAAASGATLATASTQACPEDLLLAVPGHGSQRLILGNLRDELGAILSRTLPAP